MKEASKLNIANTAIFKNHFAIIKLKQYTVYKRIFTGLALFLCLFEENRLDGSMLVLEKSWSSSVMSTLSSSTSSHTNLLSVYLQLNTLYDNFVIYLFMYWKFADLLL